MILFSSRKLEKALVTGTLDNWVKAKYIVIPAVVFAPFAATVAFFSPRIGEKPSGLYLLTQFAFYIATMFITYFGMKLCFRANEKIDGKNFIERFSILLLPVALKLYCICLPLTIVATMIVSALVGADSGLIRANLLIFGPLMVVFPLIYYALLFRSFRRLGYLLRRINHE
ncbi:MAG TPA: hypothetical protein PK636_01760 [bacterium]|nr:hypothetical protein [bacterium]HPJ71391.1 hypothetical protein [bacterium]HPQ67199.1 hypothetical protein [bacterium]